MRTFTLINDIKNGDRDAHQHRPDYHLSSSNKMGDEHVPNQHIIPEGTCGDVGFLELHKSRYKWISEDARRDPSFGFRFREFCYRKVARMLFKIPDHLFPSRGRNACARMRRYPTEFNLQFSIESRTGSEHKYRPMRSPTRRGCSALFTFDMNANAEKTRSAFRRESF